MSTNVSINGIELPCDPDELNFGGKKRGSVHRLIDGGTVVQDRGFNVGDQTIQVKGRLFDNNSSTKVKALYALYRASATFAYTDFKGNSGQVTFMPGTESLRVRPVKGSSVGYEYELFLQVVSGSLFA